MNLPENFGSHRHTGITEISWTQFGQLCNDLVEKITRDYQPEVVVGIAKGGVLPAVVISSALYLDFFPIKLSSRANEARIRETPRIFVPPTADLAGRRALLVDDMCVKMQTLDIARTEIEKVGAGEVRCATLTVHNHSKKPEWYALCTDDLILYPWDKEVYVDGVWRLHREYAAEIEDMGLEHP